MPSSADETKHSLEINPSEQAGIALEGVCKGNLHPKDRNQCFLGLSHAGCRVLVCADGQPFDSTVQEPGPTLFPLVRTVSILGYVCPDTKGSQHLHRSSGCLRRRLQKDLDASENGATWPNREVLQGTLSQVC